MKANVLTLTIRMKSGPTLIGKFLTMPDVFEFLRQFPGIADWSVSPSPWEERR